MNRIKPYIIEPQNSWLCKNFLQIHNLTQWNSFDEQGRVCSLIVLEILLIFLIIYTLARHTPKKKKKDKKSTINRFGFIKELLC